MVATLSVFNDLGRGAIVRILCMFEMESHETGLENDRGCF